MAKISLNLDERSSSELKQVRIRINHGKSCAYVATGITVKTENYSGDMQCPVAVSDPAFLEKNKRILGIISKCNKTISELTESGEIRHVEAKYIKEIVDGTAICKNSSFIRLIEDYMSRSSKNTSKTYQYTIDTLVSYMRHCGISENSSIEKINYPFLRDMDNWMIKNKKLSSSTRSIVFRCMRATYNEAINCRMIPYEDYPFRAFKIKKAIPLKKQILSEEGYRKLMSLDLRDLQGRMTLEMARDVWSICMNLCGMNLIDIYKLPNIAGDTITCVRTKEEHCGIDPVNIRITPELYALIHKYKGKTHLFNFAEKYKNYETFQNNIRHRLNRLGIIVGEDMCLKICRHTWATYASKLGIEKYVVSKSLGHADGDETEFNYIIYDWERTNDANRKVIDYAMHGVKENSIPVKAFIREYKK